MGVAWRHFRKESAYKDAFMYENAHGAVVVAQRGCWLPTRVQLFEGGSFVLLRARLRPKSVCPVPEVSMLRLNIHVDCVDICHKVLKSNPNYPKIKKDVLTKLGRLFESSLQIFSQQNY